MWSLRCYIGKGIIKEKVIYLIERIRKGLGEENIVWNGCLKLGIILKSE